MADEQTTEKQINYFPVEDVHTVLSQLNDKIDNFQANKEETPEIKAAKAKLKVPSVGDVDKSIDDALVRRDARESENKKVEAHHQRGLDEFRKLEKTNKELAVSNDIEWTEEVDDVFNGLATACAEKQAAKVIAEERTELNDEDWKEVTDRVQKAMNKTYNFEDSEDVEEAVEDEIEEVEEETKQLKKKISIKKPVSASFVNDNVNVDMSQTEFQKLQQLLENDSIDGDDALLIKTQMIKKMSRAQRKEFLGS